ncbi:MAG: four helix bundle protein [Candidatus Uhrbacteria bacterium]
MLENLFLARYATTNLKLPLINVAGAKLDLIKFFMQIGWELTMIDNKKFAAISVLLVEIGKMVGGWKKSLE